LFLYSEGTKFSVGNVFQRWSL